MPDSTTMLLPVDSVYSVAELGNQFATNGYCIVRGLLSDDDLAPIIGRIEAYVNVLAEEWRAEAKITNLQRELAFIRRWDALVNQLADPKTESGWNDTLFGTEIHALLSNPKILNCVEQILGPEVWANGDYWIRPKRPNEDATTLPWHQDSTYYPDPTEEILLPTLWIPLVDVDEHNGCLEIIPGSHKWGLQPTRQIEGGWFRVPVKDPTLRGEARSLPMRRGDVLIFSNLTFHRSGINSGDHVRWSLDLRYSRPGTWMPNLENMYPGFRVLSRSFPDSIEAFDVWAKRKQLVRTRNQNITT